MIFLVSWIFMFVLIVCANDIFFSVGNLLCAIYKWLSGLYRA